MTHRRSLTHLLLAALLTAPLLAFAQTPSMGPAKSILLNIRDLLPVVVKILITLAFVVFGWGIVKLIIAGGDTKKISGAKGILTYGIIGIFVLASILGILTFIKTYIGIPDNAPITVPKFQ